ncbi:MAG: hypothetical protein JSS91_01255 [Bacteroidetes bacterium]|nr:hypothetical protein [Bacteroidota bacterium]
MAKTSSNILSPKSISYRKLLESAEKIAEKNNLLIFVRDKILSDEIVDRFYDIFTDTNPDRKNHIIYFNADDKVIENILNECSNSGLFAERKVVVVRNVKKFLKNEKAALTDYIKRSNPDTFLILISNDEEADTEKIFAAESINSKDDTEGLKTFSGKINILKPDEFSENELAEWLIRKFDGYKISEDTVRHLLKFSNYSPEELNSEVEKLKTFCYTTKEITNDSVNLCNGIAKDFSESDFIKAVLLKNSELAVKIYRKISLKKDVEVYLIFLLSSAFTAVYKLRDPSSAKLNDFSLKRELKIWSAEQYELLPLYRKFASSSSDEKIKTIFGNIYDTDILLKSSGGNKFTKMYTLISNICSV